ncbi:MAG: formylglycine-generating enzyme family protein, partial [Cellvibrionaceae bacterium]|nr:formylglycine-generating enzyme family protein [Cellvibrionaceae bacterium]
FKGEQNPVEKINWLDCWQFIQKLKEQYPTLRFTLPSEAQWEYACRAGTATPFSFGNQIYSDLANFDGNYPYNDGKKSKYREKTIPVRSLPANQWGLYEMHGNVWEWCQDNGLRDYNANEAVTDPGQQWLEVPDSDSAARHPVRGGRWGGGGRICRSAHRLRGGAGSRNDNLGFRLALGPELQQGGVAAKGRKARFQSSERSGAASQPETSRSGPDFLMDHDDLFRLSESKLSGSDTLSG